MYAVKESTNIHFQYQVRSDFQSDCCRCFILDLLIQQYMLCYVNLIGEFGEHDKRTE
jgi:hypothetical protein